MSKSLTILCLVVAAILAMFAAKIAIRQVEAGVSAREKPTRFEETIARTMRSWAIPRAAKEMTNPVQLTPEVLTDARRHYADHCAICHGNDGRGDTEMGRGMYPKPPDMSASPTQTLSDGELYSIIHNGIRLTGMPAWGSRTGPDNDSWALVHMIRHLPQLTPNELSDMQSYNPKSPAEMQEEKEEENFLNAK